MNPTATELSALINGVISSTITTSTGSVTDTEINNLVHGVIDAIDNLDTDRPVKVRNLNRS